MKKLNLLFISFFLFQISLFAQLQEPLVHADQMPYFNGCEDLKNGTDEKRTCSNEVLVAFLAQNVQYPTTAKLEGTEGTVYVSFVIDEEGKVIDSKILRDIGSGCGEAALSVVSKMPDWEPAVHEGEKVKVKLNLPIQFYLKNTNPTPVETDDYTITWGTLKGKEISSVDLKSNMASEIIVRDQFGDPVIYDELIIAYKKGKNVQNIESKGRLDSKQKRLLKKVKAGGMLYVGVVLEKNDEKVQVGREFDVK